MQRILDYLKNHGERLDSEIAAQRLALRDGNSSDRIGGRDRAYHDRVDAAFRAISATAPDRFVEIDAARDPQAIQAEIRASVEAAFLS